MRIDAVVRSGWLILFVVALTVGVARADDVQPSTYARGLARAMKQAHVVEVPLVEQEGGKVVLANRGDLLRAGVIQVARQKRPEAELDQVLHALSLRPATPAEIRAGKAKYVALATRYSSGRDSGKKGDGRAALIGDLVIRDRRGRVVGALEVQSKGVGTGLAPEGANQRHGTGKALLEDSIVEAVMSDYLQANGNSAHGWLSVVAYDEVVTIDDGAISDRAAVLTRVGTFLRIGHLEQVRDSPALLRSMLADINGRLSRAMGRKRPMDMPQLFRELTRLKAHDLSDLYWSRVAHGSLTGDNIGLFETIDLATANIVRGSDGHAYEWTHSPGYAFEPHAVLDRRYAGWLMRYMKLAATPAELARLEREIPDPERMGRAMLLERNAFNALLHAGFDRDDITFLLREHKDQAMAFAGEVMDFAQADRPTSKEGRRIGLFNVFGAVSHLAQVSSEVRRGKPDALLGFSITKAAGDPAAQVPRARALLASYAPLLRAVQKGRTRAERRAKLTLIKEQARYVNRAVEPMGQAFHTSDAWREMTAGLSGTPRERARAQAAIRAYVRRNVRRGPESIPGTVAALRHDQLPRLGRQLVLSETSEEGVTIRELSDGAEDSLQVTLSRDRMRVRDPGSISLVVSGPDRELRLEPTRVSDEAVVFEVPVDAGLREALPRLDLRFRARRGRTGWDNGGFGFGRDVQWRLASPLVHAELAAIASARGQRRAGVTPSTVRAVAAPPYAQRGAPLAFGNVRRASWQNHTDRYRVLRRVPSRRAARPARPARSRARR